ncbi:MAG: FAD-binding and (Fe-S)-binding domain-containing protein [Anaerolineales bacterium]
MDMLSSDFLQALRRVGVETRTDAVTRTLYSTDASIYRIEPLGAAFPRDDEELAAVVEIAAQHRVPLLPRGAGSSLAGQAVGVALILDLARHLTDFSIDPENRTAVAQPGAVLGNLNRAAARYGLQFGPDPASADRATIGGVVGNNATGAHSIRYGMTADHLLAADVLLADGQTARFEPQPVAALQSGAQGEGIAAALYRFALDVRAHHVETIRQHWPQVWRRASGYNLNYLLPWSPAVPPRWEGEAYPDIPPDHLNLAALFAGSEGTLGILQRVTLRLVERPRHTVLGVLAYENIAAACDDTPRLLSLGASAVELLPRMLLQLARTVPAYASQLTFVQGDPAALLMVEFAGDDPRQLRAQAARLGARATLALTPEAQAQVWNVRKVGLGLLMSRPGDAKPIAFIEDVTVPVEHLGAYVRSLERIFAEHGVEAAYYAHASAGCLHVRPILDLRRQKDLAALRSLARAATAAGLRLGGTVTGEHGNGLARAEWLPDEFGTHIVGLFRELKGIADPQGILNPGKVVDAPPMDVNLRYGVGYQAEGWQSTLDFSSQSGLTGAIEQCNGAGVCRKSTGVMCPTFQATQEEMHSTRGRANLLRAMISGALPDAEEAVRQALDLCLACKGCKAECPSAVDMAKLKYAFEERYYRTHRRPLRDYLFAFYPRIVPLGAAVAPLANAVLRSGVMRWVGIAAARRLPAFAAPVVAASSGHPAGGERVLYLADAFTRYTEPQVEQAAQEALGRAGFQVQVLPVLVAGRPLISKGFLQQAKAHLRRLLQAVRAADPQGRLPVVGVEPSEIYTLRDELRDFFPGDADANALAGRAWMVDEFLLRSPAAMARLQADAPGAGRRVLLHTHCYQKARPPADDGLPAGGEASAAFLRTLGYAVEVVDAGCCGMAGAFGYEAEHYDLSMRIGEERLFPAVRAADAETIVAAVGTSCRHQIADGAARQGVHPVMLWITDR